MIYTYRGMQFDIDTPKEVLVAIIEAETAETAEERADAAELVEGGDNEVEAMLPSLHAWHRG